MNNKTHKHRALTIFLALYLFDVTYVTHTLYLPNNSELRAVTILILQIRKQVQKVLSNLSKVT